MAKSLPAMQETQVRFLGLLEKEMATHSSILVWKIPWTEEPGRLQSMGSQRVRHFPFTFLGLYVFTAEGLGSITGQGTKISQAACCSQKKKKRERIEPLSSQEISRSISSDGSTLKPKCVGGAGV